MKSNIDNENLKSLYTTLFGLKYSADGNYLAACNNFGEIALYNLKTTLSPENLEIQKKAHYKFKALNSCLYCLENANDYLVCGAVNEIVAWKWKDLIHKEHKQAWSLQLTDSSDASVETNSIVFDSKNEPRQLYAACGNGEINSYDLECCKLIRKYKAHKECIYQITLKNNSNELVSVSEDGCVKIWDLRTHTSQVTIKPYEHQICARPHLGQHINCVTIDEDNWMICGGGPKLTMWHLRSMKPMAVQDPEPLYMPNTCLIHENQIITGGNTDKLYSYSYDNILTREIPTTSKCIYDIGINYASKSNKVMCIAGAGSSIDLCINFSYKSFNLKF